MSTVVTSHLENATNQPPPLTVIPDTPTSDNAIAMSSTVAPTQTVAVQEPSKQLDVTDALSYLDQVKVQFESLPAIYNR